MAKLLTSIVAGALLGIIASRFVFVGSWLSLVPWAIAGLAIGYWGNRRDAVINGALYGFVLCFVFMVSGYSGHAPVTSHLPAFALLGMFGAVCGLVLGLLGYLVKTRIVRSWLNGRS